MMAPPSPGEDLGIPGLEDAVEIGSGGFATVYRARQPAFGREVAVKVIDRRVDDAALARFRRECLAIGQLGGHPAIISVFDAGQTARGRPYLLMPFLEGGSLQDRLDRGDPLRWQEACEVGVRLASALDEAHRSGVLHRDLKPANVLVDRYGAALLADFGIARVTEGHETTSGTVTASLAHAAPEVLNGARPTAAADVYSLGSTLYMLISGRSAFHSATDESILPHMHRIMTTEPPPLGDAAPPLVEAAIRQAMAKDPADRPPGAVALAQLLQQAQAAMGVAVTPLPGMRADGPVAAADPVAVPVPPAEPSHDPHPPPSGPMPVWDPLPPAPPVGDLPPPGPPFGVAAGAPLPATTERGRRWWLVGALAVGIAAVLVIGAVVRGGGAGGAPVPEGGPDLASLQPGALPAETQVDDRIRGLEPGAPAEGELAQSQAIAYRFAAPEVGWMSLVVRGRTGDIDPVVALYDVHGTEVGFGDDGAGGRGDHDAVILAGLNPFDGPFTALVASYAPEQQGGYEIELAVAEVRDLPPDRDEGEHGAGPADVPAVGYRLEAQAGERLAVAMRSEQIDALLQLYTTDGELLAEDDDGGGGANGVDARLEHVFDRDGSFVLLALVHDSTVAGTWTLEVEER